MPIDLLVVVPPPRTGMTIISQEMAAVLSEVRDVRNQFVQRRPGISARRWAIEKHLNLLWKFPWRSPKGSTLYMVPDAGRGLWGTVLLAALAKMRRRKLVLHHHAWAYLRDPGLSFHALLAAAPSETVHIVLSQHMEERIRAIAGKRAIRTHILSNAGLVRAPQHIPEHIRSTRPIRLGMLGNLTIEKGVDTAIKTAIALQSAGFDVTLSLAGPIDPDAQRLICDAANRIPIDCPGAVDGEEKYDFLGSLDLLLFPSHYRNEAEPLVIWESLAAGTPVAATCVGAISEMARFGAILVSEDNGQYESFVLETLQQFGIPSRIHALAAYTDAVAVTKAQFDEFVKGLPA